MTRWRSAFGVCMLSAALLVGSAGVATADHPDSGGSTAADSQAAGGSSQDDSSTAEPAASTTETGTSDSPSSPHQAESAGSPGPMTLGAATTTEETVVTDAQEDAAADMNNNDVSASTSAAPSEDQGGPDVVAGQSKMVAPPTDVVTLDTQVIAPANPPVAVVSKVIAPVTNAIANAARAVMSFPAVIAWLPSSPTPVTDVITAVQNMLTSAGALGASLARMPSEFASLLGFPGMAPGGIGESLGGVVQSTAEYPFTASFASSAIAAQHGHYG